MSYKGNYKKSKSLWTVDWNAKPEKKLDDSKTCFLDVVHVSYLKLSLLPAVAFAYPIGRRKKSKKF